MAFLLHICEIFLVTFRHVEGNFIMGNFDMMRGISSWEFRHDGGISQRIRNTDHADLEVSHGQLVIVIYCCVSHFNVHDLSSMTIQRVIGKFLSVIS